MYKPTYTWPNPAFPFRLYYTGKNCRIFIIENIQHNWNWMSKYRPGIKETDYFFVYCGWYHDTFFAKEAEKIFSCLNLRKENFFIMFNSQEEMFNFARYKFQGDVINHNAWLDENHVMHPKKIPKRYDAVYTARLSAFKRHHLASNVNNLALVAGLNHGNAVVSNLPGCAYKNDAPLTPEGVCTKINESVCGLILSEVEGACFSSSEYLLCGIPVVSTHSKGGRDVWYSNYNAIVVPPDPGEISAAVRDFVSNPRDPERIRAEHVRLARYFRSKFTAQLQRVLDRFDEGVDAEDYFQRHFFHKMRKSINPDFQGIFGGPPESPKLGA